MDCLLTARRLAQWKTNICFGSYSRQIFGSRLAYNFFSYQPLFIFSPCGLRYPSGKSGVRTLNRPQCLSPYTWTLSTSDILITRANAAQITHRAGRRGVAAYLIVSLITNFDCNTCPEEDGVMSIRLVENRRCCCLSAIYI